MTIDPWLLSKLACPIDHTPLAEHGGRLVSGAGREYEIVEGIPVLMDRTVDQLRDTSSKADARTQEFTRRALEERAAGHTGVDYYVREDIVGTNGRLYSKLKGNLDAYPIPAFPRNDGGQRTMLDIGCNWGRWIVAGARAGYRSIGIDPGLDSLMAAKRVARDCGVEVHVVNAGCQRLPFRTGSVDLAHSFSVLQHLPKPDVHMAMREIGRVLVPGGESIVQITTKWGPLSLYHQGRRGWREARDFEVRFWTVGELRRAFGSAIGPSKIRPHAYFTLNPIVSDLPMLPSLSRSIVRVSEGMRAIAEVVTPLMHLADSVWVTSTRPTGSGSGSGSGSGPHR